MAKTQRVYTLDELKEKCPQALADPKLVEIVKTAPLNKDGKVNLSWVYNQAEDYVHEQTKDLQKTKELAVETRFLAMLRRDHAEEFEKLISATKSEKTQTTLPKRITDIREIEFKIPGATELNKKTEVRDDDGMPHVKYTIRFIGKEPEHDYRGVYSAYSAAQSLCINILNALIETAKDTGTDLGLSEYLIQLLEEKFGLKIKVCGNCEYNKSAEMQSILGSPPGEIAEEYWRKGVVCKGGRVKVMHYSDTCKQWTPKKVSDKKEN